MSKLYLAIIGHTGAGKESCYIAAKEAFVGKLTVSIHHFSDLLNEILNLLCLEKLRPNQQLLSTVLRQAFGENLLGNVMFKRVMTDAADIVFLDGVRRPKDVEMLKQLPNSFLGSVYAPPEIAWVRLRRRADRSGDSEKTWEDFQKEQMAESESLIDALLPLADFKLDNSLDDPEFKFLRDQISDLISEFLG